MQLNVLVIGNGGREHAIAAALAKSPLVGKLYCMKGNAGIAEIAECVDVDYCDLKAVGDWVDAHPDVGYTVIAPDDPLALGLADELEARGHKVFGPNKRAAQIEPRKARQRRRGIGDLSAAVVDVARRADADDGAVRARAVIIDRLADILHDMISAVFRLGGHGRTMQDLVRSAVARPATAYERGLDARAAYIHADQLHFITCTKRLVMSMGRVIELPMTTA